MSACVGVRVLCVCMWACVCVGVCVCWCVGVCVCVCVGGRACTMCVYVDVSIFLFVCLIRSARYIRRSIKLN